MYSTLTNGHHKQMEVPSVIKASLPVALCGAVLCRCSQIPSRDSVLFLAESESESGDPRERAEESGDPRDAAKWRRRRRAVESSARAVKARARGPGREVRARLTPGATRMEGRAGFRRGGWRKRKKRRKEIQNYNITLGSIPCVATG